LLTIDEYSLNIRWIDLASQLDAPDLEPLAL